MKYVTFTPKSIGPENPQQRLGSLNTDQGTVTPLNTGSAPDGLLTLVEEKTQGRAIRPTGESPIPLSDLTLLAPIPRPHRNIICVGKNYAEHAVEFERSGRDATSAGSEVPTAPIFFTKATTSVIGPQEPIDPHATLTDALDYEAEIAVIIGAGGRNITREDALNHVWGYTLVNDITARDLQTRHKQWFLGKSLDTFCPMGPWAVTADEINIENTWLECRVNGELRQRACTADLIFDVPDLIATLSAGMTLAPGDLIATGTPAGVALGFDPPRYLTSGDVVEVSADGLGVLRNEVAKELPRP